MNMQNRKLSVRSDSQIRELEFPTFDSFYAAVHGFDPFVWQSTLADSVWNEKVWPDQVSAPTGAGKTSTLDIAVWVLARQVHEQGISGRTFPLRIFLTVERRLVVDGAAEHAAKIAQAIECKPSLVPMRTALSQLLPNDWDGEVLGVTSLHGGKPAEKDWLRPFGAQIITCTVTQLSSRTLFRGVGVAPGSLPIHAALTGLDRLILVDEPHLVPTAVPMWRNAEAIQSQFEEIVPLGQTVVLGATVPPYLAGSAFVASLEGDPSPVAQSKLGAVKPALLKQVSTPGDAVKEMAEAVHDAWQSRDAEGGDGIVVVANTIDTAVKVRAGVEKKLRRERDAKINLLTSTVRPLDRSDVIFGKDSVTVATQTIEVGVDLDACALITELAAMPALMQRFGRLNRSGGRKTSTASIFVTTKGSAAAAIYGDEQVDSTQEVLENAADDGFISDVNSLRIPEETWEREPRTVRIEPFLPRLTATRPKALVPWEALAYGPDLIDHSTIVVAWRENLDLLDKVPILPAESITIPLWAARKFVSASTSGDAKFSDTVAGASKKEPTSDVILPCRIRSGETWVQPAQTDELLADSTLVLDTTVGGYSASTGWTSKPAKPENPVQDHSMRAVLQRGRGYFDAGVLLGQEWISAALDRELDFTEIVIEKLQEMFPSNDFAGSMRVEGRLVAVGGETLKRDFGQPISLADHSLQVASTAEAYAVLQGLSDELVDALKRSGQNHDYGKSDQRFQQYFNNFQDEPLAKPRGSVHRTNKGLLPIHWRHEVLSARSVEGDDESAALTRYLILTHHGWGRRLTNHAGTILLNTSKYEALERKFGPWGLALLEATLRIADWHSTEKPRKSGQRWEKLGVEFTPELEPTDVEYVSLKGMRPYSLNMLFGGIGALAAAGSGAKFRVRDGIVQIATDEDILWDSDAWNQVADAMVLGAAGIDETRTVIKKQNKWRSAFKTAMLEHAPTMESMLLDSYPEPDGGRFFSVPIHNRNGNPFHVLKIDESDARVAALFDPDSEKVPGKLNGGLDTGAETRMTGDTEFLYSEHHLAWSIAGMAALGMPATEHGIGVNRGILRVPLPDFWVTLEELRDLFISPLDAVSSLRWRSVSTFASQQVKLWEPILSDSVKT